MPKDQPDIDDPLERSGVALFTEEDTTGAMCECLAEEYLRLGYGPEQVLALFRNPFYAGTHWALLQRGEACVRETIERVFARWGKPVVWTADTGAADPSAPDAEHPAPAGQKAATAASGRVPGPKPVAKAIHEPIQHS